MTTTTIRLSEGLKAKIARAAKRAGTTSHSFILEAIAEKAELVEQHNDFLAAAETRYAAIVASGKTIPPWNRQARLKRKGESTYCSKQRANPTV